LKGSGVCAILTARPNLTCTPGRQWSHWPPNIEDAHAIALQLYENIARNLMDWRTQSYCNFYVSLILSIQIVEGNIYY
jgi:hypothetical protein